MKKLKNKELLVERTNGNYRIGLYKDGTRIRECSETKLCPEYPDSIDLKITDFCDLSEACPFCHESSDRSGKHANLSDVVHLLSELPHGTELAIGGGNPLAHPDIYDFLSEVKRLGLIANLTVNQLHTKSLVLQKILSEGLVHGLGISWRGQFEFDVPDYVRCFQGSVLHLIAGVDDPDCVPDAWDRILVLGYKNIGRGNLWRGPHVEKSLKMWFNRLPLIVTKFSVIGFDNLAVEQLKVQRLFCDVKEFEQFFQGDEGQHSFYVDAVSNSYAISSSALEKKLLLNLSLYEAFHEIRNRTNV